MYTFNTLDELFDAANYKHQITGQELINRRTFVYNQWQEIALSEELNNLIIERIVETSGGRSASKDRVRRILKQERPQHYALQRFYVSKYGDSPAVFDYCAYQEQSFEMAAFRKYFKR